MDFEWPTKIHNPYRFNIYKKYIWMMDFLWNGYGFRILKNMDDGMDMDLVSNPSEPTAHGRKDPKKFLW